MTTLLQQAINLAQAGNRQYAEALLRQLLADQPDNETALMWLSAVTPDVQIKRQALRQALALNPNNALAQKGLTLFGAISDSAEPPSAPVEEAEQPGSDTFAWPAEEPLEPPAAVALPEDEMPPAIDWSLLADDAAPAAPAVGPKAPPTPVDDFDWPETPAAELSAPVFNFGPDDEIPDVDEIIPGDFSLDAPAIFETPPGDAPDDDLASPFDFDQPAEGDPFAVPAVLDDSLPDDIPTPPPSAPVSDELEALFSVPAEEPAEADILPPDPELLTEPEISLEDFGRLTDKTAEEAVTENLRHEIQERSRRQNRLLIAATAFISILIIGGCGLYYYLFQVADLYTLLPPLAGAELTVAAPTPKDGVSVLKFKGYPAYRAKIEWETDQQADTCTGTSGLEINFQNGDALIKLNNRLCTDAVCSYEKDISPGPIKDATLTYKCGKNAVVTLYHQP